MSNKALKLALEALEYANTGNRRPEIIGPAITAIREALAQPQQEPIEEQRDYSCEMCNNKPDSEGWLEHGRGCYVMQPEGGGLEFIVNTVRTAQPQQKPVAWMYTSHLAGNQTYITRYASDLTTYKADKVTPLYTSPPARKPLTDEEIAELYMSHTDRPMKAHWEFARAIEAAHGIKENT